MFKKKKKKLSCSGNWGQRSGVRICERSNYADTKVRGKGGRAAALGTGAEIALQPVAKTMVK